MTAPSISKLVLELFKTVYAALRSAPVQRRACIEFISDIYQANTDFVFWRWKCRDDPCPLSEVKRTCFRHRWMSAFEPKVVDLKTCPPCRVKTLAHD